MDTNKNFLKNFKPKKQLNVNEYFEGIIRGNISVLSQAITLIESNLEHHKLTAQEIIEKCLPYSGKSIRIGITGVPGVGKSTFIETFGNYIINQGKKLCVLAIDPSSQQSKGSILGDKTRMESLSSNSQAFIRPSPSGGTLGGVARKTREIIILCEAAGFDTIFIETVGVGQSETAVNSMVDFFMLLMLVGAGDELQGIKRGIMEMADAIILTKADSDNIQKANLAKAQYENALHLFPAKKSGWMPKVHTVSAIEKTGIDKTWQIIEDFFETVKTNNYFEENRKNQTKDWLHETIIEKLKSDFFNNPEKKELLKIMEFKALNNHISPFEAAKKMFEPTSKETRVLFDTNNLK